jgi:hypothetical protein
MAELRPFRSTSLARAPDLQSVSCHSWGFTNHPEIPHSPLRENARKGKELCRERGYHDDQELIDPESGGYIKCRDCGREIDCEDPDGDLG